MRVQKAHLNPNLGEAIPVPSEAGHRYSRTHPIPVPWKRERSAGEGEGLREPEELPVYSSSE